MDHINGMTDREFFEFETRINNQLSLLNDNDEDFEMTKTTAAVSGVPSAAVSQKPPRKSNNPLDPQQFDPKLLEPCGVDLSVMFRLLMLRRGHMSHGEATATQVLGAVLKELTGAEVEIIMDGAANQPMAYAVAVPKEDGTASRTMFSAHVDTVHRGDTTKEENKIYLDMEFANVEAVDECLGADDAAGVCVLLHLIRSKVPGLYVFHRGEECGGIGSNLLVRVYPKRFEGKFDRAIAFDRRGTSDIITHQGGQYCASDTFAKALAKSLADNSAVAIKAEGWEFSANTALEYLPSNRGSFTDTKVYRKLIPECTNVSVGYDSEHSSLESLNLEHLVSLCVAAAKVKWEELPTARDPKEEPVGYERGGNGRGYQGSIGHTPQLPFVPQSSQQALLSNDYNEELYDSVVGGDAAERAVLMETEPRYALVGLIHALADERNDLLDELNDTHNELLRLKRLLAVYERDEVLRAFVAKRGKK